MMQRGGRQCDLDQPAGPAGVLPGGLHRHHSAIGSRYVAPPVHSTGLSLTNPAVILGGGNITLPLTNSVTVDTNHLTCAAPITAWF